MTAVKICGLRRKEDIEAVNKYVPDYIGFVFAPSKRQVTEEKASELKKFLKPGIKTVGVFVNQDIDMITDFCRKGIIDIPQLHGNETEADINYIKKACDVPVIKAVSVQSTEDILRWRHSLCDILLLDNGAGGTGESFDWNLIEDINKPFFIAGGINEKNVLKALAKKPYGIDVSGGVETDGFKDPAKIKNIIETIRRGD